MKVIKGIGLLGLLLAAFLVMAQNEPSAEARHVMGETVFVPAYSEIFYGAANRLLELTTTLAIHNTSVDSAITITSVQYFDTDGNLVHQYAPEPLTLAPMATTGFVVESRDRRGGWGANFLVEWEASQPVFAPAIEAVMVSAQGTEGVSLISIGRVLSQRGG